MNLSRALAALSITLLSTAVAAPAEAGGETYACYCEGYCGNGGVGANPGKLMTGMGDDVLEIYFGVTDNGSSMRTGWTCLSEASNYACQDVDAVIAAADALQTYEGDAAGVCAETDESLREATPADEAAAAPTRDPRPRPQRPRRPAGRCPAAAPPEQPRQRPQQERGGHAQAEGVDLQVGEVLRALAEGHEGELSRGHLAAVGAHREAVARAAAAADGVVQPEMIGLAAGLAGHPEGLAVGRGHPDEAAVIEGGQRVGHGVS